MTTQALLVVVGVVVAVAAGVRSTWSPCGLSMLSIITPVSETAKGHSYRVTASWFTAGAVLGGATLGAAGAIGAAVVAGFGASPQVLALIAAGASLVALFSDLAVGNWSLPVHRRQVNERWLDHYRPWVYGSGFGWQIGVGLATYITTAAVYLVLVLATLTATPLVAVAIGTTFGLVRGLAVFLTRSVRSTPQLLEFHRRFSSAGPTARKAVVGVEGVAAVVLATASWIPLGLLALAAIGVALVLIGRSVRPEDRVPVPEGRTSPGRR